MKIELEKYKGVEYRWEAISTNDGIKRSYGLVEKDGYNTWFTPNKWFSFTADDLEAISKAMKELK